MKPIYCTEKPKVGLPIQGWDPKAQRFIVTTPVVRQANLNNYTVVCTTEANGVFEVKLR